MFLVHWGLSEYSKMICDVDSLGFTIRIDNICGLVKTVNHNIPLHQHRKRLNLDIPTPHFVFAHIRNVILKRLIVLYKWLEVLLIGDDEGNLRDRKNCTMR